MTLMFKYTQGGQSKRLLVEATDTGITFNYSEFMYKSSDVYYGWKDIISPGYGKYYCQQGDSWIEQYQAGSLSGVFNFTGENAMKLTGSDSFHGSGTDQWSNGIEMTYGEEGGTCEFSWYTFTTYTPDPVSYIVSGGLFDFCPDGDTTHKYGTAYPEGSASGYGNVYTTESAPSIAFWTAKMYDDYNEGREEYHKTFDVLIIAISASTYDGTTQRAKFTIVDMRLLKGADQIKPTKSTAKGNTPMGFRGDRNDYSDTDTESSIGTGISGYANSSAHGVHLYDLSAERYDDFVAALWDDSFWNAFQNWRWNPIGGIISLHLMPCLPDSYSLGADNSIVSCGKVLKLGDDDVEGYCPPNCTAELRTDVISLKEYSESFLDWGANTSVKFRLPFIGVVPVDVNKIMSGGIYAKYNIDFITGNCLVQIYTIPEQDCMGDRTNDQVFDNGVLGCCCMIAQYAGNCAHKLTVAGSDMGMGQATGSIINTIASVGTGIIAAAAGAYPVAAGAMLSATASETKILTARHDNQVIPATPNADTMGMLVPAVIIDRPIDITPLDEEGEATVYEFFNGRPAACGGTVKDYKELDTGTGLFIKGILHADTLYATENEKQEIERAFAKGVYI